MKVAIARREITPQEPSYMAGHAIRVGLHQGVHDPLFCTVLLIEANTSLCFVNIDVVMVDEEYSYEVKKDIAKAYEIAEDNVYVSFLHNHSGPEFTESNVFNKSKEFGVRDGYREGVKEQILEMTSECIENLVEVDAFWTQATIEGYYGNRNDNSLPSDKSIDIIQFNDETNTPRACMLNFSCHSTVLGSKNYLLSTDLAGAIRNEIEENWNVMTTVFIGSAGDVSNRQFRSDDELKDLVEASKGIYKQIDEQANWMSVTTTPIIVHPYKYVVDYLRDLKKVEEEVTRIENILATSDNPSQIQLYTSGVAVQKSLLTSDPHVYVEIKGSIIEFGDFIIVTIPAELFTKFGLLLKKCIDTKKVLVFGYTDYSIGYMVEEDEYGKNYESMASMLQKGDSEKYTEFIIDRIQSL